MVRGTRRALVQRPIRYLFRDRFGDTRAAGSLNGTPADGRGTRSVTDTGGVMSTNGALVANGTTTLNDGLVTPSFDRVCGRAFAWKTRNRTTMPTVSQQGLARTALTLASVIAGGAYTAVNTFTFRESSTVIDALAWSAGEHQFIAIARTTGSILLGRDGTSGPWTVIWLSITDPAGPIFGKLRLSAAANFAMDDWRLFDLGLYDSRFASDEGLATARIAANNAGDTIAQTADGWIEQTLVAATGVTKELLVRWTNDSNCWAVRMDQAAGRLFLYERNAGGDTERGATGGVAQTWANGTNYRINVLCEGTTIKVFVDFVLKITYASATFQQTAVRAKAPSIGSELKSYPRLITLRSDL